MIENLKQLIANVDDLKLFKIDERYQPSYFLVEFSMPHVGNPFVVINAILESDNFRLVRVEEFTETVRLVVEQY